MNLKPENILSKFIPAVYLFLALIYLIFIIQPEFIFHHVQPPFIYSNLFFSPFLKYPGGPAELLANLILQMFYYRLAGSVVFFLVAFFIAWMMFQLLNSICKSKSNRIWALIPFSLTIILSGNYNFPFTVNVSVLFLLLILLVLVKTGKNIITGILIFTFGAVALYWFAGSGYLLVFSAASLFIKSPVKNWAKITYSVYVPVFTILFMLLAANFLFAVSLKNQFLWFYEQKAWFMSYKPSPVFIIYLVSIPLLLAAGKGFALFQNRKKEDSQKSESKLLPKIVALFVVFAVAGLSHFTTFNSDAKKIVEADFFCYSGNAEKTAKAATSLKEYNFSANLNYNLVMSKTGNLTENFFGFLQIKGAEAMQPDVEFASQLSFIASDFYYDLGFISEARHWAYESLVFYPYSIRAMQSLVKIHLVTGEYKAAEKMLRTLEKVMIGRKFVKEFMPYVTDTTMVAANKELMEKRSFIPSEYELNPSIDGRLRELLAANGNNKKVFEFLMLFYLVNADAENFSAMVVNAPDYFSKTPAVYEEALLMFSARTGQPIRENIKISDETQNRYNSFVQKLEQFKGKTRLARNALYAEYGKTYLYFLQFVYPNIQEPEIVTDENEYPAI